MDNSGPQTARQLNIKISWPLKGISGRNLTYLQEEPMVAIQTVNGNSNKYSCTSETPDPNRLKRQGKKKIITAQFLTFCGKPIKRKM